MGIKTWSLTVLIIMLASCGLECIDKKTGNHQSSESMKFSQQNNLFQFEVVPDVKEIVLDSGRIFRIRNAWVENSWSWECVNNSPVIHKQDYLQMVIDGKFKYETHGYSYDIGVKGSGQACALGSAMSFSEIADSTLTFIITKSKDLEYNYGEKLVEVKFHRKTN